MASPPLWEWAVAGGACALAIGVAVVAALRGPPWWRAAMFGTGAAISFAFTSACTKAVSDFVTKDPDSVFLHFQTYALAVFGGVAVFLAQNALHAGPIVAAQSTLVLVDPLASILIGVGIFGDSLRTSGPWGPLEAISLLLMFAGAYWLAQSPIVSGIYGADQRREHAVRPAADGLPGRCVSGTGWRAGFPGYRCAAVAGRPEPAAGGSCQRQAGPAASGPGGRPRPRCAGASPGPWP